MERSEKYTDPTPRLLLPIDASYQPSRAVTKIPAISSLDEILAHLERDGGVILTNFVSLETLDKVDEELEPCMKPIAEKDGYDNFIGRNTLVIPGLVGKSDTMANILDTNETIEKLLKIILEERYSAVFENHTEELVSEPLLSISVAFNVGHGSPRQALHRDDMVFSSKHHPDMKINEVDGFSCFIAGTRITRENGGTMVILGSHKWEHDRHGRPDEVSFLEMERGDAFVFLSTMAHGAGYNTIPGEIRKIYNLVFARGTLRQEENQFLCNPRSKVLKMSPKLLSLLGFKKPVGNWLGMVENQDPAKDLTAIYEKILDQSVPSHSLICTKPPISGEAKYEHTQTGNQWRHTTITTLAPEIPKRMKAIQLVEIERPYEIREVDVPTNLDPPDLLVKVAVASYCRTDAMVEQGIFSASLPLTAAHEGSGTIVAVGSEAAKHFQIGDRVMMCGLPLHPCGAYDDYLGLENQRQYCMNLEAGHIGLNTNGCFAEYVKCDSRCTTKLPNEISFMSAAPLACAGRRAWGAVLKTGLKTGEWVCFIGSGGGLGHLGVQFAKALGLKVIGVDARDEGLELSKRHGADVVADARKGKANVVKEVHAATAGKGADATICLSDHKDASGIACAVTKMHGTMVQVAQPDIVEIPLRELIFRDIRIIGSVISGGEETKSMLDTVVKHGVTVTTVPFKGLDEIDELSKLVQSGKLSGKVIIVVDPEQIEHEKEVGTKF